MNRTAPDNLWGTENTTQFHPIGDAPEAPVGKRYWCDDTHHEIGGSYQDLGKGPEGRYKNIEQLCQFYETMLTTTEIFLNQYIAEWPINCTLTPSCYGEFSVGADSIIVTLLPCPACNVTPCTHSNGWICLWNMSQHTATRVDNI